METCHRFFFAIRPPEGAVPYLLEEQRRLGPGGAVRDERLHLTTAISKDYHVYPSLVEKRLLAVGASVVATCFPIVLDQVAAHGNAVVMRPSEPLRSCIAFQRRLMRLMIRAGVETRKGWQPHPHVTLLYRYGWHVLRWTDPLSWLATEFVLIHSHVGMTRHRELGRWPLQIPASPTLH